MVRIDGESKVKRSCGTALVGFGMLLCSTASVAQADSTQADSVQGIPQVVITSPADGYRNHAQLVQELRRLEQAYPGLVASAEVVRSPGGRAVQAVRVAAGAAVETRAALLVVANAWGPHLIGSEIAIGAIEHLASSYGQDPVVTQLLDDHAVYVVPRANPDAAEVLFAGNLYERVRNDAPVDDDQDQTEDEDGPEDLDGNGMITMLRVTDAAGDWVADSTEPDLVRKADRLGGERGGYTLHVEGVDSDRDGVLNDDPLGGVDINANFSYGYEYFKQGAGLHPLSSPEARAIAQLFIDQPNIAAVYVLGPQDNLMKPWSHSAATGIGGNAQGTSAGGPLTSVLSEDEDYFRVVSERFATTTGMTGDPPSKKMGGDVLSFSYYHMGRWAFGSRGWWIPDLGEAGDDDAAHDRNAIQWVKANVPGGFVDWSVVQHPDYPDAQVEVGGLRPYVTINPPAELIDSVVSAHSQFVVELGSMLPKVSFGATQVESLGDRVFRITTNVHNDGYLPTVAAIGARVRWPRRIRLEVRAAGPQSVLSGQAVELVGPIAGSGGSIERSWVVVGAPGSTVTIRASSPVAGAATVTVTLQ